MIGVVADDLTGTAEMAAVALRHGLRAEIVHHTKPKGDSQVVCIDTDSRSCDVAEAARRASSAANLLWNSGAKWIYKKVDSVLRGQVTAEIEAVMGRLHLNRALLLPANPSLGRVIQDGRYFVRGKPIHKTEFARDVEFPRRVPQVLRLLKMPRRFMIRVSNGSRCLADDTIVVAEAATAQDVNDWANRCDAKALPAGGADFFSALLQAEGLSRQMKKAVPSREKSGREFFVCGSASESTRRFIIAARRQKTPIFALPRELIWGRELSQPAAKAIARRIVAAFETNNRVILCVGLPLRSNFGVAPRLSKSVVEIAATALKMIPVENIFAEGGATSAELVRKMGWRQLTARQEIAPGILAMEVHGRKSALLTIKPGSYSWPEKWV
jgi:D-threonate/D-erythronate kinase